MDAPVADWLERSAEVQEFWSNASGIVDGAPFAMDVPVTMGIAHRCDATGGARDFDGLVVKIDIPGLDRLDDDRARVLVRVGAGEAWHGTVARLLDDARHEPRLIAQGHHVIEQPAADAARKEDEGFVGEIGHADALARAGDRRARGPA